MAKNKLTRLFYVVESRESNPELFNTLEDAKSNAKDWKRQGDTEVQVSIRQVKNAYVEKYSDDCFNYDDRSDTFEIIKIINTY